MYNVNIIYMCILYIQINIHIYIYTYAMYICKCIYVYYVYIHLIFYIVSNMHLYTGKVCVYMHGRTLEQTNVDMQHPRFVGNLSCF